VESKYTAKRPNSFPIQQNCCLIPSGPQFAVDSSFISIDQATPLSINRPTTVAELGDLVKRARASSQGVYPVGGRTTLDVGMPPLKPGIAIDTTALSRVIDYPARDMTITVQAGITIARVQAELANEGQWLPVDVPEPEKATIGGAIALNQSGPHRYGYGTLRDYVIGISFVTDDGVEVKAGGRVVKNVAGYDLMKLQIGALGTLGIVTQVTLKVKPRPETSAGIVFGCASESIGEVLDRMHASKSRPVVVELLKQRANHSLASTGLNTDSDWMFAVGFEEKATTVNWQVATLLDELKSAPVKDVTEIPDPSRLWAEVTALQTRRESWYIGKASVLPSKLASFVRELAIGEPGALIHAHALNGIVWFHSAKEFNLGEGHTMRRCPPELKKTRSFLGKPTADWELMRHIKKTLDPDNVFNPGRLFGDV
jgi:glycolate oxidase FAD binding subunit